MLKKIVNIRLSAANWLILSFLTVLATACSISYKFNGASIDYTKVKTITIRDFTNQAPYVNPTLAPQFTEDLKDILKSHGFTGKNVRVMEEKRPLTLTEVFPDLLEGKRSINVKI